MLGMSQEFIRPQVEEDKDWDEGEDVRLREMI
jgi:hypothetical protein